MSIFVGNRSNEMRSVNGSHPKVSHIKMVNSKWFEQLEWDLFEMYYEIPIKDTHQLIISGTALLFSSEH